MVDYLLIALIFFNLYIVASCIDRFRFQQEVVIPKFIFWAIIIFVSYLVALRGGYPDVDNYRMYFETASDLFNVSTLKYRDIEIGYYYYSSFVNTIGLSFETASFLLCFLSVFVAFYGYKDGSPYCYSATTLFIIFSYAISLMIQVRQGAAIGLSVCVMFRFLNKKYISSLFFYFLAINFHISALVIFPVILLSYYVAPFIYRYRFFALTLTVVIGGILNHFKVGSYFIQMVMPLFDARLSEKAYLYMEFMPQSISFFSLTNILMIVVLTFSCFLFKYKRYQFDKELFAILIVCFFLYNSLAFSSDVASRIFKVLSITIPIGISVMLSLIFDVFHKSGFRKSGLVLCSIVLLCLILFYQLNFIQYELTIFNF